MHALSDRACAPLGRACAVGCAASPSGRGRAERARAGGWALDQLERKGGARGGRLLGARGGGGGAMKWRKKIIRNEKKVMVGI
jgi:hypothetical protein